MDGGGSVNHHCLPPPPYFAVGTEAPERCDCPEETCLVRRRLLVRELAKDAVSTGG